jgi:hypothetical protein
MHSFATSLLLILGTDRVIPKRSCDFRALALKKRDPEDLLVCPPRALIRGDRPARDESLVSSSVFDANPKGLRSRHSSCATSLAPDGSDPLVGDRGIDDGIRGPAMPHEGLQAEPAKPPAAGARLLTRAYPIFAISTPLPPRFAWSS